MAIQKLNDSKFTLKDDGTLLQSGYSEIIVSSLADLPSPTGSYILLPSGHYIFNAKSRTPFINPYTLRFATGANIKMSGLDILSRQYVYVGGLNMFECESYVLTLDISKMLFADGLSGVATAFNIVGASRSSTFFFMEKCIFSGFKSLGTTSNIYNIWDLCVYQDFGQGIVYNETTNVTRLSFSNPKNVTKDTLCTFDYTTNKVLATSHYIFNCDKLRFKSDGTLPAEIYTGAFDINGAVIDNGDGTVRLTTTADHSLEVNNTIFLRKTTNYNNTYKILATPTTKTFDIEASYIAETLTNAEAQLIYFVLNRTVDDFQMTLEEINLIGQPVDNGDGTVNILTEEPHNFLTNDIVCIGFTDNYNGEYTVLSTPTANTFKITATYANEIFYEGKKVGKIFDFTDNGTGDHYFYENSICETYRGSIYSFNHFQQVYNLQGKDDVTAIDFEPTISGISSRGNSISLLFGNEKPDNVFTGSSLTQKYKYFKMLNTLGNASSKISGELYFTENTTDTSLTLNTPAKIVIGSPSVYLADKIERIIPNADGSLTFDNPDIATCRIDLSIVLKGGTSAAKVGSCYVYVNGENATVASPEIDVLNRNIFLYTFELINLKQGDVLEMYIENKSNSDNFTVFNAKLSIVG